MLSSQIYLITKLLNEGIISVDQAREMADVTIEKEFINKNVKEIPQRIFAY